MSTVMIFLENESDLTVRVVNIFDKFRVEHVLLMEVLDILFVPGCLFFSTFVHIRPDCCVYFGHVVQPHCFLKTCPC